jgi:hypothetical protein
VAWFGFFSAQSLCSLRLSGELATRYSHRRDAEHAENPQRAEIKTLFDFSQRREEVREGAKAKLATTDIQEAKL